MRTPITANAVRRRGKRSNTLIQARDSTGGCLDMDKDKDRACGRKRGCVFFCPSCFKDSKVWDS